MYSAGAISIRVITESPSVDGDMELRKTMPLTNQDSKVHGANMGPTWVLSAPDGPHVGPMNLAIRGLTVSIYSYQDGNPCLTISRV